MMFYTIFQTFYAIEYFTSRKDELNLNLK
jgi:hypothetical protein